MVAQTKKDATEDGKKRAKLQEDTARFVVDEEGCIVHVTRSFAVLVNLSQEKTIGENLSSLLEFHDPDDALRTENMFGIGNKNYIDVVNEGLHKIFLRTQSKKDLKSFQFDKIETGNGRRFIVGSEITGQKIKKQDSKFTKKILSLIDENNKNINTKNKISPASDEGELRHFLNMSNDVMAVSYKDGTFSRVNKSFNDIFGYTDEEFRQKNFIDLVHAEDRAHIRNCLYSMMHEESSEGQIIDFETRMISKSGSIRQMELRQKRSKNTIYTVGRDVTEIKENETSLRKKEQMLSEAQAIGRMGHWRWTVGADDIVWSDEIYRIFGVKKDDFIPTLDHVNAMLHRRDIGRLMQAFQRAIIEQNNYEIDFRVIGLDKKVRYIRCEGKCELDEKDEVIALFGIMQDITERTLNERQLKEAKNSAERAYASKTQFLANMSHELRTPLNAIIGFSEMMQRQLLGPIGTEKYLDYIGGIRESGELLLDLISDILDMSKIEAGKYDLDLEELNVSKVIRLAVHMVTGRAQEAHVRINIDIKDAVLKIICDRRAFMQILLNLLSNAVKFTRPGGHINVECTPREDYVSIKVSDTGIGIPANKIKCITNPFEQAASHYTREHEGTGLGLAITKDLVELHGGSMHIESTVDVGTCVTIRLPYDAQKQIEKNKKNKKTKKKVS